MYRDGQGVDKDAKHAVEFYTVAADQGIAEAQFNLGLTYEDGAGVKFFYKRRTIHLQNTNPCKKNLVNYKQQ